MKSNPIVHFEIPADDVKRAKMFYEKTFGWEIEPFDMPKDGYTQGDAYYMVRTTKVDKNQMPVTPGAINGGLLKRQNAGQVFTNYISVSSIKESSKVIAAHGGVMLMPKTEIAPGMGWIAMFKDTEGNIMGLHEVPSME